MGGRVRPYDRQRPPLRDRPPPRPTRRRHAADPARRSASRPPSTSSRPGPNRWPTCWPAPGRVSPGAGLGHRWLRDPDYRGASTNADQPGALTGSHPAGPPPHVRWVLAILDLVVLDLIQQGTGRPSPDGVESMNYSTHRRASCVVRPRRLRPTAATDPGCTRSCSSQPGSRCRSRRGVAGCRPARPAIATSPPPADSPAPDITCQPATGSGGSGQVADDAQPALRGEARRSIMATISHAGTAGEPVPRPRGSPDRAGRRLLGLRRPPPPSRCPATRRWPPLRPRGWCWPCPSRSLTKEVDLTSSTGGAQASDE